ncbi:PD-(D/E)XK nuclease family protein [Aliirhizobium cellulosilyticum]|uniref:PD-(D/E)XK nuclease superfamily protein n=1 Tax=Aliirhizobium cellulosilyticum TaxID=393664 RepID=A0A7W6UZD7_9HYPH|nr:PD-(D/E)XK nuclease family protein [Rhizobium cellulosilyticum]MBB4349275.1 hypothetical protein [Rhizobium cellulosilyticum]MBB4412503.1 hypothetical protein [Rhizobium cellulosilyticum]MBB4447135.1 hypothetical protein [Rhizobium cellulosilyticum]
MNTETISNKSQSPATTRASMPTQPLTHPSSDLSDFIDDFSNMIPRLAAMREGIDLYGATAFSPFAIFDPDENALSRVIAELLDPTGTHGQGLLFLNSLLSAIGVPRLNRMDYIKVRREVLTRSNRRVDIVIETSLYVIGIENKPWAVQQKNQLEDYLTELKADLRGRKPILVFVSDQTAKTASDETIRLPYYAADPNETSLHGLLKSSALEIKANGPKAFVADFLNYIEHSFGDAYVENASDMPYIDAVSAEFDHLNRRKAIASVLLSQEALHCRILDEIGTFILGEVQKGANPDFVASTDYEGVTPTMSVCLWDRWIPYGVRRPSWPINCHVAVEVDGGWLDKIIFGVKAPDEAKIALKERHYACPERRKLENMTGEIPGGKKTPFWPWRKQLVDSYWGQEYCARLILESPSGRVEDHPEIQDLARQFVEMAAEVDRLLMLP